MSVTYTHNGHRYRLDGVPVPSVTTILNGGLPKPALVPWAARTVAEACADLPSTVDELRRLGRGPFIAALAAVPNERRDAAAIRGTDIHHYAEQVVAGEPVEVPAEIADAVSGYASWLDAFGFVADLTERTVANRVCRYAGRFDVYGHTPDVRYLLDVKTSKGVYGDSSLQLAAYARAEFYVDEPLVGDVPVEIPMPDVDRIGVLHVRDDGTDLYDLGNIDAAFAEFRAAQVIYAGKSRRDRLVDLPVRPAVGELW